MALINCKKCGARYSDKQIKCHRCGTRPSKDNESPVSISISFAKITEQKDILFRLIAGFLGGGALAILGVLALVLMGSTSAKSGNGIGGGFIVLKYIIWIIGFVVAFKAPSTQKAWRRLLIPSGILSLFIPLSTWVFSTSMVTNMAGRGPYSDAVIAGTVIGGGLVSGVMGFIFFPLGMALLVIGLLVGRDKQIIYVQSPLPGDNENI